MDESRNEASSGTVTGNDAAEESDTGEATPQEQSRLDWEAHTPQPTVLSLQDLIDLPKQILPEPTYRHLKNAGVEAWLAVTTLFDSLSDMVNSTRRGTSSSEGKGPRRINVE
jgi:hypothetical protein